MSRDRDPDEMYREAAEGMAELLSTMIGYLGEASERTLGGRWRKLAEHGLRRFHAAQSAKRQRNLFDEE